MGDHHHGHLFLGQLPDDLQDLAGKLRVERRGGLVEKEDAGIHGQSPGDGHPLLLPAGELARMGALLVAQAHLVQKGPGLFHRLIFVPLEDADLGVGKVLQHRPVGEEIEVLEHQTEIAPGPAQLIFPGIEGLPVLAGGDHRLPQVGKAPAGHFGQEGGAAEKGGFSRAGGADDGHGLPFLHGQVDVAQDLQLAVIGLLQVFDRQQFHAPAPFTDNNSGAFPARS